MAHEELKTHLRLEHKTGFDGKLGLALFMSPDILAAYSAICFAKERIILTGSSPTTLEEIDFVRKSFHEKLEQRLDKVRETLPVAASPLTQAIIEDLATEHWLACKDCDASVVQLEADPNLPPMTTPAQPYP